MASCHTDASDWVESMTVEIGECAGMVGKSEGPLVVG